MLWPVPGYYGVTSRFHDQRSYGLHLAIDIAAPDVPCVAVGNGIVVFADWAGSAGRSVYIELENGYRVHYCHLSSLNVVHDQAVDVGQVIGCVGGSGHGVDNYYGSHLHLNLFMPEMPYAAPGHYVPWVGMWAIDPELYLEQEALEDDMPSEAEIRQWIQKSMSGHENTIHPELIKTLTNIASDVAWLRGHALDKHYHHSPDEIREYVK